MGQYDVAVIGRGATGPSTALVLSRTRRGVLVMDASAGTAAAIVRNADLADDAVRDAIQGSPAQPSANKDRQDSP
jgi:glycine/D-amino acid oxidase-like deaminating enzyme